MSTIIRWITLLLVSLPAFPQSPVVMPPADVMWNLNAGLYTGRYQTDLDRQVSSYLSDPNCPILLDPAFTQIEQLVSDCDQRAENLRNSTLTPRETLHGAVDVCSCYMSERNLWGPAMRTFSGQDGMQEISQLLGKFENGELGEGANRPDAEDVNSNIRTESFMLKNLRNGLLFQASYFAVTDEDQVNFSSAFNQDWITNDGIYTNLDHSLKERFQREFPGQTRESLTVPGMDRDILNGKKPYNSCVSERDYLAWRQYPEDNNFYRELSEENEQLDSEMWDYNSLAEKLKEFPYINRAEAMADPRAAKIIRRLDFLHGNPIIKNLFIQPESPSADNLRMRQDLFRILRSHLIPSDRSCWTRSNRGYNSCQSNVFGKSESFRQAMATFIRDRNPTLIGTAIADQGRLTFLSRTSERNSEGLGGLSFSQRVFTAEHSVGADEIRAAFPPDSIEKPLVQVAPSVRPASSPWSGNASESLVGRLLQTSSLNPSPFTGLGETGSLNDSTTISLRGIRSPEASASLTNRASSVSNFFRESRLRRLVNLCPRVITSTGARPFLMNDIERQWALEASSTTNRDGILSFSEFSNNICANRMNRASPPETGDFNAFMRERCGTGEEPTCDIEQVRKDFRSAYPVTDATVDPLLAGGFSAFRRASKYENLPDELTQGLATAAPQTWEQYRSHVAQNLSGSGVESQRLSQIARRDSLNQSSAARQPAQVTQSQPASPSSQLQAPASDGSAPVQVFQPTPGSTPAQAAQQIQTRIRQGESEAQQIRDQISSLREEVQRDTRAGNPPNTAELREINDRIAGFERRLAEKDRELQTLREQNASLAAAAQSGQRSRPRSEDDQGDAPRNASFRASSQPSQAQGQQAPNVPVPSAPSSGGGQVAPTAAPRLAPAARRSSGGVNSALLSSRGQSGEAEKSGNAITVTQTSSTDYQDLLSQTAGNEITESLPAEVFDQVSATADSIVARYRDRIRALPGQVVRLELSEQGSQDKVELIFIKEGDEIRVATRNGRAIASEAAPEPVQRESNLYEELVNETQQLRN